VKELEQIVAEEKCLKCGKPASFERMDPKSHRISCTNSNCHSAFGFTVRNEEILRMSEDAILSLEVIGA
jgi:hypothetical protein